MRQLKTDHSHPLPFVVGNEAMKSAFIIYGIAVSIQKLLSKQNSSADGTLVISETSQPVIVIRVMDSYSKTSGRWTRISKTEAVSISRAIFHLEMTRRYRFEDQCLPSRRIQANELLKNSLEAPIHLLLRKSKYLS